MFKPEAIFLEKGIENYQLGKELLEKYKDVPKIEIENHKTSDYLVPYTTFITLLFKLLYKEKIDKK